MSLVVWLPLNGDLTQQGLSNATAANNGATVDNSGKIGKCYSFNGTDNYISLSKTPSTLFPVDGCSYSFSSWVYCVSAPSDQTAIVSSNNYQTMGFGLGFRPYRKFVGMIMNSGSSQEYEFSYVLPLNEWHHITLTFDSSTKKQYFYVDGSFIESSPTINFTWLRGTLNFWLGRNHQGGWPGWFNGKLNDFRIYDHALSAKEVKELAKGLVLHYRLAGHTMLGEPLYTHTDGSHWIKLNHHNNKSATVLFTQANALWNDGEDTFSRLSLLNFIKPNSAGVYEFLSYQSDNNTWRRWTQTSNPLLTTSVTGFTNISNATRGLCKCSANTLLAHTNSTGDWWGAVGCWTAYSGGIPGIGNIVIRGSQDLYIRVDNLIMDDTIEYDCSGYKYNGTKSGTIVFDIDSPRYESSYKVGLTKAYISTPNIAFERMPQGTLNIWINRHSSTSDWRLYACFANGYNWTSSEMDFIIIGSTGGTQIYLDCCSNVYSYTSTLNEWHMYTITWDLQQHTSNIYIDGEHVHTTTNAKIDTLYASKHNYHSFGNQISSDVNDYSMSDARIYSTVLSAEDIAELYHSAVIVDNTGKTYAYEYFEAN